MRGGKDVLPAKLPTCISILSRQRIRQLNLPESFLQVALVQFSGNFNMIAQVRSQGIWQNRSAVLFALPVAHNDLPIRKINIFHAQAHALHQAKTASIEKLRH